MSEEREIEYFKVIKIIINTLNIDELHQVDDQLIEMMKQKLEKIAEVVKNLEVYTKDDLIIIHDKNNIVRDMGTILNDFGFLTERIESTQIKGTVYAVSDELIPFMRSIGITTSYQELVSRRLAIKFMSYEMIKACEAPKLGKMTTTQGSIASDMILSEMIQSLRTRGEVSYDARERIVERSRDARVLSSKSYGYESKDQQYVVAAERFKRSVEATATKHHIHMMNGTKSIIVSRARQMGYGVTEKRIGNNVELVLVRMG